MPNRLISIWHSFRALPLWVQIWMALILVPVNMGGLLFLDTPQGRFAALLGISGMLPNLVIVWVQQGFSKAMAFPHLPIWTPLVIWLLWTLTTHPLDGALRTFLVLLAAIDVISLGFDYPDAIKYLRGDRDISGHNTH